MFIELYNQETEESTLHEVEKEIYELISELYLNNTLSEGYIKVLENQLENPTYYEREDGNIEYRFLSWTNAKTTKRKQRTSL